MTNNLQEKREAIISNPAFIDFAGYFYEGEYRKEGPPEHFVRGVFEDIESILDEHSNNIPQYKELAKLLYDRRYPLHPPEIQELAHEIIDTSLQPDFKTNIYPKSMEELMLLLSDFHSKKYEKETTMIGADYSNLGGFYRVLGSDKTSEFVNLSAAIIRNGFKEEEGVKLVQMTNLFGSDELTMIVEGDSEKVESAMRKIKLSLKKLIEEIGMDVLEHAKHPGDPKMSGLNVVFGSFKLGGEGAFSHRLAEIKIEEGIDDEKERQKKPADTEMLSLEEAAEYSTSEGFMNNAIERYRESPPAAGVRGRKLLEMPRHRTSGVGLMATDYRLDSGKPMLPEEALLKKLVGKLISLVGGEGSKYIGLLKSLIFMGRYDPITGLKRAGTFRLNYHDMADGSSIDGGYLIDFNLKNMSGLNSVFCHYDVNAVFVESVWIMQEVLEERNMERYASYRTGGKSFRLIVTDSDQQEIAEFAKEVNRRFDERINQKTIGEHMERGGIEFLHPRALERRIAGIKAEDDLKQLKICEIPHKRIEGRAGAGISIVATSIDSARGGLSNVIPMHSPVDQIQIATGIHKGHVFTVSDKVKHDTNQPANCAFIFEAGKAKMCLPNAPDVTLDPASLEVRNGRRSVFDEHTYPEGSDGAFGKTA